MAPTICSEKKNQLRSGIKKIRRHSHTSQMVPSSPSSIFNYVTSNAANRSFRRRSSSTSSQNSLTPERGTLQIMDKNAYHILPVEVVAPTTIFDSDDASLPSTYEFSAPSPQSCCIDERLSPYSFYHDDDNFNSIDSDFNQAYISSSFKNNNSSTDNSVGSLFPMFFECQRKCDYYDDLPTNFPFSLSQLSEVKNTAGLFEIAVKTIKLVKRNQMLQRRLAQLQHETSEFIQSVLANPENRAFRENIQQKSGAEAI